jgi:hypothetical protein
MKDFIMINDIYSLNLAFLLSKLCHNRLKFLGTMVTSRISFRNPRPLFSTLPKRWQPQQNSWNQQSSQTGGNIQDQRRTNGAAAHRERGPGPQQMGAHALDSGHADTQNRYDVPGFASEVFN